MLKSVFQKPGFPPLRKIIPNQETNKIRYNKNFEIDIVEFCSLSCLNCNRSCASHQAPSNRFISIDAIKDFLHQVKIFKWDLENIHIVGGEPTLHPQFFQLLEILQKSGIPNLQLTLITNGYSEKTKQILNQVPKSIKILNSKKTSNIQKNFVSFNVAPIDLEDFKGSNFSQGCQISAKCGYGLGVSGFYPCCVAAGIDRVFKFNLQQSSLQSLTTQWYNKTCSILCRFCGHFHGKSHFDPNFKSQSWVKAYG